MASDTIDPKTGKHLVRAYAGINPDTKMPRQISTTLPADASDVEIETAKAELDNRAAVLKRHSDAMTIGAALSYYIVDAAALGTLSPTTISPYESYLRRHIIPRIGSVYCDEADERTFSDFYRELRRPKENGGAGLAATTVEKVHSFMSGAFSKLKSAGMLPRNPILGVSVPHEDGEEVMPLSASDLTVLIDYLESVIDEFAGRCDLTAEEFETYVFAVMVWVDLNSGIRRGELAGLQDRHVIRQANGDIGVRILRGRVYKTDIETRKTSIVAKGPKTKKSKRFVTLDMLTLDFMGTYRAVRDAMLAELGIEVGPDTPLFCHADGSPFKPKEITDGFKALVVELGLDPDAHLHTLRHTHASYLIENGANLKDIQDRFGHSKFEVTAGLYGHLMQGRDAEVSRIFAGVIERHRGRRDEELGKTWVPMCPVLGRPCARYETKEES